MSRVDRFCHGSRLVLFGMSGRGGLCWPGLVWLGLVWGGLSVVPARGQAQWSGSPSPHDGAHLVVVRPQELQTVEQKTAAPLQKESGGAFGGMTAPLLQPVGARVQVRHAGEYGLWVRIASPYFAKPKVPPVRLGPVIPVEVQLLAGERVLVQKVVHDGPGQVATGGPAAYADFAAKAKKTGAEGQLEKKLANLDNDPLGPKSKGKPSAASDLDDDLLSELKADPAKGTKSWIDATRLEEVSADRPGYWWKVGSVALKPGVYELRLAPQPPAGKATAPAAPLTAGAAMAQSVAFDGAFLSTAHDFVYPHVGEIAAPKASYIRFRLGDEPASLPEGKTSAKTGAVAKPGAAGTSRGLTQGVTIGMSMRVRYDPWQTGNVWLNPVKPSETKAEPHTEQGYTRWYRLQDVERAPGFGAAEAVLRLNVQAAALPGKNGGASRAGEQGPLAGATQFAVFPHQDYVLREIDWSEPEAFQVSLYTDFETYLHKLRTIRDHAREDYDRALAATGGQVFPLTRGPLYFGNAWGAAPGEATDYMVKTLRLLGMNCVGQSRDPLEYRKLYGWSSHAGQYWPPAYLPFQEADVKAKYDEYYKDYFSKNREFYEGVSIFQLADEPGEIARQEMSAPLWRFVKTPAEATGTAAPGSKGAAAARSASEGKWIDVSGNSELSTKRTDLSQCVLEGRVEKHGGNITFRVAVNDAKKPTSFAYWTIGVVSSNREANLAAGKQGTGAAQPLVLTRPGAVVAPTGTEFKIVHDGISAALYLNKRLIHQHTDLPKQGGFGFAGPPKAISELRLRPMRKDERLAVASPDSVAAAGNESGPAAGPGTGPGAGAANAGRNKNEGGSGLEVDDLLDGPTTKLPDWAKPKPLEQFVKEDWVIGGGMPEAHAAFREWAKDQGLSPRELGASSWDDVRMLTVPSLIETPSDARLFYHSRRFSGYMTPRMFAMAADAIQTHAPNPQMKGFVALSGHALYFPSQMPLDMFQLAKGSPAMMPGVSDWMSLGGWRWDCHQAVAFSVAMYNAGARRYSQEPASFPMMHCVWPSEFRAYTMLANQVKYVSFYNFGPSYAVTEGHWNDADGCYVAVHNTANRAAQVDDILSTARSRPSRVALLYAMPTEYWNAQSSFADKRATFLGLSHAYYQPEVISEDQVEQGALKHYDALYVLEPYVSGKTQETIATWVKAGGLLWTCADALRHNEYREPRDLVQQLTGIERTFPVDESDPLQQLAQPKRRPAKPAATTPPRMSPVAGGSEFLPHTVVTTGMPDTIATTSGQVRGKYDNGQPAWIEQVVGKGKVVYLGHRPGLTYTAKAIRRGGHQTIWSDTARAPFVQPLLEKQVSRELLLSESTIVSAPMSNEQGTVVLLYNMHPTPSRQVEVVLREPARPLSVEYFAPDADGHASTKLVPLPFEYRDGNVRAVLPAITAGQMIVVRTKPAAADTRLEEMRTQTVNQLQSKDPRALSAGAWFAGLYPQWQLEAAVIPLLQDSQWEVRHAAAEALGRLGTKSALEALAATVRRDRDTHVLASGLNALVRHQQGDVAGWLAQGMAHRDGLVRKETLRGLEQSAFILRMKKTVGGSGAAGSGVAGSGVAGSGVAEKSLPEASRTAVQTGLLDLDLRVRDVAVRLWGVLGSADEVLAGAKAAWSDDGAADPATRGTWAAAVAQHEGAFTRFLTEPFARGDAFLLAVATQRQHPELAKVLQTRIAAATGSDAAPAARLAEAHAAPFVYATMRQKNGTLSRLVYERRASLPGHVQAMLPIILEHTFSARLGDVLDDWDAYLKKIAG